MIHILVGQTSHPINDISCIEIYQRIYSSLRVILLNYYSGCPTPPPFPPFLQKQTSQASADIRANKVGLTYLYGNISTATYLRIKIVDC